MYTEIDYYYDGTLNAVICNNCIKQYEIDNADYTNLDTISSHKYWNLQGHLAGLFEMPSGS